MLKEKPRESYVPSQTQPIDWKTVSCLQNKRNLTKKKFNLDAVEYAIDRALQAPKRQATGEKLAKDLFRDGKRVVASTQGLSGPNYINKQTYYALKPLEDHQPEVRDGSFMVAIETVKAAFLQLLPREALALYMRTMGFDSAADVNHLLGVTVRQYRNLYNQSRLKLRAFPEFKEAYFLLYINSDEAGIKDFFTRLINNVFNYQLS